MENEKINTPNIDQRTEETKNQEHNERLFTQDEVNDIVKKRLEKQKKSVTQQLEEDYEVKLRNVTNRESAVELREKRIECREFLTEKGYPEELLSMLDTSEPEQFKKNAENLQQAYEKSIKPRKPQPLASNDPSKTRTPKGGFENTKHKPKQWEFREE